MIFMLKERIKNRDLNKKLINSVTNYFFLFRISAIEVLI